MAPLVGEREGERGGGPPGWGRRGAAGGRGAEGFDGYLEKPIRYKEFLASVATLLEGRNE